jgi:TrmH family RNA methyltransferase
LIAIRKAIQRAELTSDGLLPIEGPKLLQEAIRSGLEVTDVFLRHAADGTMQALRSGQVTPRTEKNSPPFEDHTTVYELSPEVFKTIQSTETSQGVIALIRPPSFPLEAIVTGDKLLIVVLARLQDPGNVGTILRISESFFATGCVALNGTASLYNSKTLRASAGSVFRLPHVWNVALEEASHSLKNAGVALIGTSPTASKPIDHWNWNQPTALMIGNEGSGLSPEELECCDDVLRIPHNPEVESLNSAIATAVILYEASKHERIPIR